MPREIDLMRKGALTIKKEKLEELTVKIDRLVKDITTSLFMFDGVESINIKMAEQAFKELKEAIEEYQKTKKEIKEFE